MLFTGTERSRRSDMADPLLGGSGTVRPLGPIDRRAQVLMNPQVAAATLGGGAGAPPSGAGATPWQGATVPQAPPGPAFTFHSMASPSPIAAYVGLLSHAIGRRMQQLTGPNG